MSESQALVAHQNGDIQLSAEKTKALWAQANGGNNSEVARALAQIGDHYFLDPALGEIAILGNKVYITFEGFLRIAEQHPQYEGYELRPMNEQERKDAKVGADEFAYVCHVYRKDRRFPSVGYGVASDVSVSAAPLRVYKREIAEKRAFHRALRMAFRAGIPDYDETIERMEYEQPVVIEQLPSPVVAEKPPAPPAPDWPRFWAHIKGLGVEHEEAHKALGIGSLKDWPGSLDEAITAIERYVFTRDTAAAQQVATPAQPIAPTAKPRRPLTRLELETLYRAALDEADVLGVPGEMYQPSWPDDVLIEKGKELKAKNRAAEVRQSNGTQG